MESYILVLFKIHVPNREIRMLWTGKISIHRIPKTCPFKALWYRLLLMCPADPICCDSVRLQSNLSIPPLPISSNLNSTYKSEYISSQRLLWVNLMPVESRLSLNHLYVYSKQHPFKVYNLTNIYLWLFHHNQNTEHFLLTAVYPSLNPQPPTILICFLSL